MRAESAPTPPRDGPESVFTCPSCRERVRDTRHDARVTTLLDMYLALNPDRAKPEAEKKEMDAKYKKGERVMPKLSFADRTPEQRRLDEEERRLLEQVQQMSLREAVADAAVAAEGSDNRRRRRRGDERSAAAAGYSSGGGGGRSSREQSRVRTGMTGRESSRVRSQSATLHADNQYAEERRRRRSESRHRVTATEEVEAARRRQVEHQSSLRSLIDTDGMSPRDLEREIEEFARQIQEEGLLDGLDLDNIDLDNNDELSRRITEAYRRRHRERSRNPRPDGAGSGARRSNTSSHSHRSEISAALRPRSRTGDGIVPAGSPAASSRPPSSRRAGLHSREPSASSDGERGRYPPPASSAALLEVQASGGASSRTRRRTPSGGRSATVPVGPVSVPAPPEARVGAGLRSQTDLSGRPSAGVIADATRSTSSPTIVSSPVTGAPATESPAGELRGLPFSARATAAGTGTGSSPSGSGAGLGISQTQATETQSDSSSGVNAVSARKKKATATARHHRPADLNLDGTPSAPLVSANFTSTGTSSSSPSSPGPLSPGFGSAGSGSSPNQRAVARPRYKEPFITCDGCKREHIEYELHFNCSICHGGEWNICLDCWRRRKGCLHWFGFGKAAWDKWEKLCRTQQSRHQQQTADPHARMPSPPSPPHMLRASRYLPPKQIPGGAEGRRTLTTENPDDRLQSGTFCCRCSEWSNECYWRCEVCNEGEWGFCDSCVQTGCACTHELLPLGYWGPAGPDDAQDVEGDDNRQKVLGGARRPETATWLYRSAAFESGGNFRPLTFAPPCEVCKRAIRPAEERYHCDRCPSTLLTGASTSKPGNLNICKECYEGIVEDGTIARENGYEGWRRCPLAGHKMVVVKFVVDAQTGAERRKVVRDLVGGRRAKFEPFVVSPGKRSPKLLVCSWWDAALRKQVERLVAVDVSRSAADVLADEIRSGGGGGGGNSSNGQAAGESRESSRERREREQQILQRFTQDRFPPEGGTGSKAVAGWGWFPKAGVDDELMFPKGAGIVEVEDMNGEWFHGFYMGAEGLFPAPYVRILKG